MPKIIDISTPKYPNTNIIIDDDDFELVSKFGWRMNNAGYPVKNVGKKGKITLHRFLIQPPPNHYIDHIDNNPLNNTRANLRICTKQQNGFNRPKPGNNTTGYKGVTFHKQIMMFQAKIGFNNDTIYLGVYKIKEHAAVAYNIAARKLHGHFMSLNQVENEQEIIEKLNSKIDKHLKLHIPAQKSELEEARAEEQKAYHDLMSVVSSKFTLPVVKKQKADNWYQARKRVDALQNKL